MWCWHILGFVGYRIGLGDTRVWHSVVAGFWGIIEDMHDRHPCLLQRARCKTEQYLSRTFTIRYMCIYLHTPYDTVQYSTVAREKIKHDCPIESSRARYSRGSEEGWFTVLYSRYMVYTKCFECRISRGGVGKGRYKRRCRRFRRKLRENSRLFFHTRKTGYSYSMYLLYNR